MTVLHREFYIQTSRREEMVDVTSKVRSVIPEGFSGIAVVTSPHTTAGMTVQENADPDVRHDLLSYLARLVPQDPSFRHMEGNSDAHIKTSLLGSSVTLPVVQGALVLGTWQAIYFCEFDGPRRRTILITLVGE